MARGGVVIHGRARRGRITPEYMIYESIVQRCTNPRCAAFADYGGRGISICRRWRESFVNFIADVGERPSKAHSLDRINNDGNYEPGNCRWATRAQQNRNSRHNRLVTLNGETLPLCAWSERLGVKVSSFYYRVARGMTDAEALSKPVRAYGKGRVSA